MARHRQGRSNAKSRRLDVLVVLERWQWTLDGRGWDVLSPGTPLWIAGEYDFDAPPPWRSLEWLRRGVQLDRPDERG